jgi:hypothetical protein
MLRSCYAMGFSVKDNWLKYIKIWDSAYGVYQMFKRNIVRNRTDLDERGWSSYNNAGMNWT